MEAKTNDFLSDQLKEIEALIPQRDRLVQEVSQVGVAWHLDHMLKVIISIYDTLIHSNPKQFKSDVNIRRSIIFKAGKIPRGRGKSPKSVLPPKSIRTENILRQLKLVRKNLSAFDSVDKNQFFKHFGFGMLDRDKSKRFIEIHTNHHLRTVRDILKN